MTESTSKAVKWWRIATVSVALAAVVAALSGVVWIGVVNDDLRTQLESSQSNAQKLYEQLISLGEKPSGQAPSKVVPGPAGADGAPGVQGPPGTPGASGAPGAPGANGKNGENGQPGAVGPQGPGPTSAQIADAVSAYCQALNFCRGATGPQGEKGAQGDKGDTGAQGPAGPSCPSGYTLQTAWLRLSTEQNGLMAKTQTFVCLPAP